MADKKKTLVEFEIPKPDFGQTVIIHVNRGKGVEEKKETEEA